MKNGQKSPESPESLEINNLAQCGGDEIIIPFWGLKGDGFKAQCLKRVN